MQAWAVQDAKAPCSELLETCLRDGPQLVTRRGQEAAVLIPVVDWKRMQLSEPKTLKKPLLDAAGRTEIVVAARRRRPRRTTPTFE